MKNRYSVVLGGMFLLVGFSLPATAEEKIQAFVGRDGRVVYTNVVENPAPVQSAPPATKPIGIDRIPASIHSLIESVAGTHGVDPALVKAMIRTESNFDRWAVSSKGALGLMQLIPGTGARFGVTDFFDPRQNIEGGVRYMKFLLQKFNGNLDLSLAAYNAGENLVERLGRIPAIPETRNYVQKVRGHYRKTSIPLMADMAPVTTVSSPAVAKPETPQIFRSVDERGVVHYSNIAPPK